MVAATRRRRGTLFGAGLAILAVAMINRASADPVVRVQGEGSVRFRVDGLSPFDLHGHASHLGKFTANGEVAFTPGPDDSETARGVVVFRAANGDLLAGEVDWAVDANGEGTIHFAWRDSVQFSDGQTVSTTGRFIDQRPAGARGRFTDITDGTSNTILVGEH